MVKEVVSAREPSIKKRRKSSNSISEGGKTEEDAYKKIVEFEEAEAVKRSPDKDAELYFQTCKDIRRLFTEIAQLKFSNKPEAQAEIAEKRVETCMLIALLKKLNRLEKFRTKTGRDALHQGKLHTDSTKLQLQNLLYELTYLKKEIAKCFQFRSLDEEIDLIPQEQFYREAPESITRLETTTKDQHQLQLSRLEWELQQRKQLASQCRQLETEKEQVAAQIVSKQERLEKLAPQLHNILEVTKPLQEHLGFPNDVVRQEHQLAFLLPNPLYLLYAKVDAYTQVYDKNTTVHICGEEEEAKQLKESLEVQDLTADSDSDQDIDLTEENAECQKRHHRKSSRAQQQQDKCNKLLASHPLYIQVVINLDKDNNLNLVLNFYYKIKLHVVTVKCKVNKPQTATHGIASGEVLAPENILRELFPNDLGEESPNPTNHYQLRQLELGSFSSLIDQLGYPYNWAQRICGLDFISNMIIGNQSKVSSELSQSSVESVMKTLRARLRSRIALSSQIQELEMNTIPTLPVDMNVPLKVNGTVTQWKRITWQEFCESPSTERLVQHCICMMDMFYRVVIERGPAKLIALVIIKNNFPLQKCIFCITVNWNGVYHSGNCDAIRDMERAVNTDWSADKKHGYSVWLLSAQIRRLLASFDIYLEVTSPNDFPQDKIYFKPTRGRNRSRPFKFLKVGSGIFTQY